MSKILIVDDDRDMHTARLMLSFLKHEKPGIAQVTSERQQHTLALAPELAGLVPELPEDRMNRAQRRRFKRKGY